MAELQWPPNQCERVNDGTGPKNKNHAQACGDIQERAKMPSRHERTGIVGQKRKRNALDNADESQLDVHDDGIELPVAFLWQMHDAINRSMIELSRRRSQRRMESREKIAMLIARGPNSLLRRRRGRSKPAMATRSKSRCRA